MLTKEGSYVVYYYYYLLTGTVIIDIIINNMVITNKWHGLKIAAEDGSGVESSSTDCCIEYV